MEQEHILNTHIDTLNEWWESAEKTTPRIGDTYIAKFPGGDGYEFGIVDSEGIPKGMLSDTRVLTRSEKPTPAWHDAVAVIAKGQEEWDRREAFTRSDDYPETRWVCNQGVTFKSEDLFDVTPLIEQKVTDEMVERGYYAENTTPDGLSGPQYVRRILTAALGLETA